MMFPLATKAIPNFVPGAAMAGCGPTLPTWVVQQVGSYHGYTGRDANAVATAAHGPGCVKRHTAWTQSGPRRPFYSPLIFAALMIGRHLSISALCNVPSASGIDAYFTRLNPTSPVPPVEPVGAANLNSSPVRVTMVRVCSVPVQFGYVLASIFKLIVFVAGSYV
jgi:hypothetical protein